MPPIPTPLSAMRTLSRFSRQASMFTPLSTRKPLPVQPSSLRFVRPQYSTEASPSTVPQHQAKPKPHAPPGPRRPPQPEYEMTFTCKPCSTRSTHRVSKQGYHHGSVLITCPECRNRHVISDHLNVSFPNGNEEDGAYILRRFSEISI
jgi:protein import protein ZIM17